MRYFYTTKAEVTYDLSVVRIKVTAHLVPSLERARAKPMRIRMGNMCHCYPPMLGDVNHGNAVLENRKMDNINFRGHDALSPQVQDQIFFSKSSGQRQVIGTIMVKYVVDGSKKSEWKSTLQRQLPVITFKLKHPCTRTGIKENKSFLGIITSIFLFGIHY